MAGEDEIKKVKKPKINISQEEFENQTREERAAYNRLVKEMDRKIKEAGEKAKDRPFNKGGGVLKAAPNKGAASLPKGVRNSMGFMKKGGKVKGYEHGGSVKGKGKGKCKIDGIAIRGKTRAKRK